MEQILAGLGSRVFLMNNTHDDQPVIFTTRWCMSYLRGPLTRSQIKTLMDPYKATQPAPSSASRPSAAAKPSGWPAITAAMQGQAAAVAGAVATSAAGGLQPTLAPDITQYFIPARGSSRGDTYQPMLLGAARVRFATARPVWMKNRTWFT